MFEANPVIRRISQNTTDGALTIDGVINRTGMLFLLTALAYGFTWHGVSAGTVPVSTAIIGAVAGLVLGLIIVFTRATNPFLIGAYALCEGAALGVMSLFAERQFPGIALQATVATFGCFGVVFMLYRFRILQASAGFVKTIVAMMFGIMAIYLANMVFSLFGHPFSFLNDGSPLSIGIGFVIVAVASLSFVLDFASIEEAVGSGVEEKDGWYLAFGLLMGLVWLYVEILRLLMNLRRRD